MEPSHERNHEGSLANAVVLVTGAAQGIGEAIAWRAVEAGATALVLADRNGGRLAEVARALTAIGAAAHTVTGDLGDAAFAETLVLRTLETFGRLNGLVNAAGVATRTPLLETSAADWDALFAVNARAPFLLMRDFVRHCTDAGQPGSIVNISSMNAKRGLPDLPVYSATKAALDALTKNVAHGWGRHRVRVNAIQVGWVDTPGERQMQASLGQVPEWLDEAGAAQPFGRLLNADDVARLAIFLLGSDSFPMTGSVIDQEQVVAGGRG